MAIPVVKTTLFDKLLIVALNLLTYGASAWIE